MKKLKKFRMIVGSDLPPIFIKANRKPKAPRNTAVTTNTKKGAKKYKKKATAAGTPR